MPAVAPFALEARQFDVCGMRKEHVFRLAGAAAKTWMEQEQRRVNQFLQERSPGLAADGGTFAPGVLAHLPREQAVALFHEFFSPWGALPHAASGKREP